MEPVGSGDAPQETPDGGTGAAGAAAGRRPGRGGRRRVVAPPTSGQSHEVESDFTDPRSSRFSPDDPAEGSEPKPPLTAHEQWILSQRPPHWG